MKYKSVIFLLFIWMGIATTSCRDTDQKKDLDEQLDGTRDINQQDRQGIDEIENADTLDRVQERDGVGEGVYRPNDIADEEETEDLPVE